MARDIQDLYTKMVSGDRVILGQLMTLVESDLPEDRLDAILLLELCEKTLASQDRSSRFAISGAPGAGKSTLIEAIGMKAMEEGHKVGVITVDPTSSLSGGSILGDKSRMNQLAVSPNAFIRSSAAGQVLGGLGRRSMEMMTLLATAGYDLIFLETVGVGQSEHDAWQLSDGFILVIQPGAGDELQGIKRGITELADIVIVNKADSHLASLAKIAKAQYDAALHLFSSIRDGWIPKVVTCSALEGTGIEGIWQVLRLFIEHKNLHLDTREIRSEQKKKWLSWSLRLTAQELLMHHPMVRQQIADATNGIAQAPGSAFRSEWMIENLMKELIHTNDPSS